MLREAELFVMAEQMLLEVVGRVRPQDRDIVLPPMHPGAATPTPIGPAIEEYMRDDELVAQVLGGARARPAADVGAVSGAACAAARQVDDGDLPVAGGLTAGTYLLRKTVERSLLAHYVAAYLGSTACPLPEELARPLSELTGPHADRWRQLGYFRSPMPLPDHVSWRDRFLLDAGHEPHPLGH